MLTGSVLGPYRVLEKLGEGGMGEVYRARDERLGRDVAIKILPPAFATSPERLRRFEQEARAAAALNHPNVLAVFDVHIDHEVPYVVTELLEGETLRELLQRGALPARKATELAVQIAQGMAAAHQKGIVHRDLKPANIFVTADGRAKILDFGLAKLAGPGSLDDLATALPAGPSTNPGAVLGTAGYMAPEQVRGEAADHRADIFAFGVVCYEMLTGRRTFTGTSQVEVMSAILRDDPPELPPEVAPVALGRIIRRCLEKQPVQRFQSASDVGFALEALSDASASRAVAIDVPAPVARRPWRLGAVVALLALAGMLVTAVWWRSRAAPAGLVTYEAKTFDRLPVMNARFMPDGQTIVYSAATHGYATELFVISPTAEAPEPLGVKDAHLLTISSKGELALIVNASHHDQRLFAGTLARMTLGSTPRAIRVDVREADWAPDGESMAIVRDLGNGRDRIEYPIGTTVYEASGYLSDPRVSADGSRVAFVAHKWRFDDRGTVMVVDRQGAARSLTDELWSIEGLAWTPDGARLVFSGNVAGGSIMQPMSVAAAGGAPARTLFGVPARLILHDIARDGRWLAVREDLSFGVRARVPGSDEERELSWLGSTGARSLSADGLRLLMVDVGQRSGPNYGVVLRATDGSQAVRLGSGSAQRLSPDGAWAAAIIATPVELVLYPTGAGEPKHLLRDRFEQLTSAQWFPDSQRLLVCGSEAGKRPRCYRQPLAGGAAEPVTDEGVTADLAPDGKTVLLTRADGSFQTASLDGAPPGAAAGLRRVDRLVGWSRDSRAVYVQDGLGLPAHIDRVELASGTRTPARQIEPVGLPGLATVIVADWVDDGRWYAYNYTAVPSTLFVVTGAPQ